MTTATVLKVLEKTAPEHIKLMPSDVPSDFFSSYSCSRCSGHMEKTVGDDLIEVTIDDKDSVFACEYCGEELGFYGWIPTVESGSQDLLDNTTAKETYWYHATNVEDWHKTVTALKDGTVPYVHVGTREAALMRVRNEYVEKAPFYGESDVFVIRLKLSESAVLASDIHVDTNDWPLSVTEDSKDVFGGDAIRYINRVEMPGSISLLVDPTELITLDKEFITRIDPNKRVTRS